VKPKIAAFAVMYALVPGRPFGERGERVEHVLAVVEEQDDPPVGEERGDAVDEALPGTALDRQRGGHGVDG
jgi:hypothetical protein